MAKEKSPNKINMEAKRKQWKLLKAVLTNCQFDAAKMADKPGFGPAMDKFADACDAYEDIPGTDQKQVAKADADRKKAGNEVLTAGGTYTKMLVNLKKDIQGQHDEAAKLFKDRVVAIDAAIDFLSDFDRVVRKEV